MSSSFSRGPFTPGTDVRVRLVGGPADGASRLRWDAPSTLEVTGIEEKDGLRFYVQHVYRRGLPNGTTAIDYHFVESRDDGLACKEPEKELENPEPEA